MDPHGEDLAALVEAHLALAAGARDQGEADRWRTIAGLWCTDPAAARTAMAELEAEIAARSDPATTAAYLRHAGAAERERLAAIDTEITRRLKARR